MIVFYYEKKNCFCFCIVSDLPLYYENYIPSAKIVHYEDVCSLSSNKIDDNMFQF